MKLFHKVAHWALLILAVISIVAIPAILWAAQTTEVPYEGHLAEIIALISGFAASIILGVIKTGTTWLDGKWTSLIKPIQPLIVAAFGMLVPLLAQKLGVDLGDPNEWVNGPGVMMVVVVLRELKEWLKKTLGGDGTPAPAAR